MKLNSDDQQTARMLPISEEAVSPVKKKPRPSSNRLPDHLSFQLPDGTVRHFTGHDTVVIGRRSPNSDHILDLDLTPHKAHKLGVSRSHAIIQPVGTRVIMKDMNSANGTRVNGERLTRMQPFELHGDDEIALGELKLIVSFVNNI